MTTDARISRWFAALPIALIPLALSVPLAAGKVFLFRDVLHFVVPQQLLVAQAVGDGRLPQWTSALYGGTPLLADPGAGVFYLPNLLFHWLSPELAATAWVLLHLPLAAYGALRLARALDAGPLGAAAGATVYVTSGYLLSMHGGHYYFAGAAWLPLVAALLLRASDLRTPRSCALAALAVGAMVLNGELQTLGFALALGALLATFRGRPLPRRLGALAGSFALGCGLAAIQLLPTMRFSAESVRGSGLSLQEASLWSLHPARWLEFLAPTPYGLAYPENTQWSAIWLDGLHAIPWAPLLYLGPAALGLAGWAVVRAPGRTRIALAALFAIALLLAAGRNLPFFEPWHRFVPLAGFFRYPEKFAALCGACVALLVALGITDLRQATPRSLRWLGFSASALAAGLLIAAGGVRLLAPSLEPLAAAGLRPSGATISAAEAITGLSGALVHSALVAAALALTVTLGGSRPRLVAPLLVAVMAMDGGWVGFGALSYGDSRVFASAPPLAQQVRDAAPAQSTGRYLRLPGCTFGGGGDASASLLERVRAFEWASGKQNFLTRFGLSDALGYGAAEQATKVKAWRAAVAGGQPARIFGAAVQIDCTDGRPAASPVAGALPRAFVTSRARSVDFAGALAGLATPGLDPRIEALVEGPAGPPGTGQDAAAVRELSPERVQVETAVGGTLVLLDTFAEGWTASVDGTREPISRAFGLFRAVAVPDGKHLVEFRYRAPGLVAGATITAVAALICALFLARTGWRRTP